ADLKQNDPRNSPIRNTFQLPYPISVQVAAAQKFKHPGHKFFDNDSLIPKTPKQVPLCIMLQYTMDIPGTLPAINTSANPVQHINYHIIAEPHKAPHKPHVKTAFSQLTNLYDNVGGLALTTDVLNDIDVGTAMGDATPAVPDDLVLQETLSL